MFTLDWRWGGGGDGPGSGHAGKPHTCKDTQGGQGKGLQLSLTMCPPHTLTQAHGAHRHARLRSPSDRVCAQASPLLPAASVPARAQRPSSLSTSALYQVASAREGTLQAGLGFLFRWEETCLSHLSPSEVLPRWGAGAGGLSTASVSPRTLLGWAPGMGPQPRAAYLSGDPRCLPSLRDDSHLGLPLWSLFPPRAISAPLP